MDWSYNSGVFVSGFTGENQDDKGTATTYQPWDVDC
jgi:hypothetical protein